MTSTLRVPIQAVITVAVHEIEGGGYRAEVPQLPGCVAQAATIEELRADLLQSIEDWWAESPLKTEAEARQLAAIQGSCELPDESYPVPYDPIIPPGWSDEDE